VSHLPARQACLGARVVPTPGLTAKPLIRLLIKQLEKQAMQ